MSTIFRDINSNDAMQNQGGTRSRILNRAVGTTTSRYGLLSQNMQFGSSNNVENLPDRRPGITKNITSGLQSRLNQNLRNSDCVNMSAAPRTFGLQSRIASSATSFTLEDNSRSIQVSNSVHQRNNLSPVSRTFGLLSEDLNSLSIRKNEGVNQELRSYMDSSIMSRPFGLQTRNLSSHSHALTEDNLRINQDTDMSYRRGNINMSALSGFDSQNPVGLNLHNIERFNQNLRTNSNLSLMPRSFGLQSKNLTMHPNLNPEENSRLNQDSNFGSNNISFIPKPLGPAVRNTTLTTGFQMQNSLRYNDDVTDNGGFRRPTMSRGIRGRNSTLSYRLFHNHNAKRNYKDLGNINGFNVSHISRRDADTLSESRLGLNLRNNWMDNQSLAGSVLSVTSMKSQFMNLLENLHHSILNIGPHVTAEAVRTEFDKAKQRLENISEVNFAASNKEAGGTSVISQSSKYICPSAGELITSNTLDGGSLNLKSSKDILKILVSGRDNYKNKFNLSTHIEEEGERGKIALISSPRSTESDGEENSSKVFKKPKAYIKKRKSLRKMKIKAPQVVKSLTTKAANKVISLKQWYPIAVGHNLAFCGTDEEGAAVKTEAVKKRLNNRKVELINGLCCNLIGSPSAMVSVLPQKIINLLKNGLTDRWRVLQKELLNCQTAEKEIKKRKSPNPKAKNSQKIARNSSEGKTKKGKSKRSKVISTPKKKEKVAEFQTRSGRTVKPPSMFWLVTGSDEITSSLVQSKIETTPRKGISKKKPKENSLETPTNSKKKPKESNLETPTNSKKVTSKSPSKKRENPKNGSPNKKATTTRDTSPSKSKKTNKELSSSKTRLSDDVSFREKKTTNDESFCSKPKRQPSKARSPKKNKKKEGEEEIKVHSSTEDARRQNKTNRANSKRKREIAGDTDSVQIKKSKLEKKGEIEVESTVETTELVTKKGKEKKTLMLSTHSSKRKGKKSPLVKKKNETLKKKTNKNLEAESREREKAERKMEAQKIIEFEEDFELKLDDIEIPEIANVSGNLQLSRSQLRLVSMETPPLKYFNSNLKLLRSATPVRSPDWCISQRTESEVKRFQRRREDALKKKIKVDIKKTVVTEKSKTVQSKDLKQVMEWVAEKTVRSPQWNSKVLQYVIPSRKQMEQQQDGEEEDEDVESQFL